MCCVTYFVRWGYAGYTILRIASKRATSCRRPFCFLFWRAWNDLVRLLDSCRPGWRSSLGRRGFSHTALRKLKKAWVPHMYSLCFSWISKAGWDMLFQSNRNIFVPAHLTSFTWPSQTRSRIMYTLTSKCLGDQISKIFARFCKRICTQKHDRCLTSERFHFLDTPYLKVLPTPRLLTCAKKV